MTRLSEKRDVQEELIHHLTGIGWRYLPPGDVDVLRGGDRREPFLPEIARRQLIALNPGLVGETNVDHVLRRLRLIPANMEGNERFLNALRGRWTVYDEGQKRERNLALIDYDDLEANEFAFTQELPVEDRGPRRLDMVLYLNGLPVAVIENKSPTVPQPELEAFDQVQHVYTAEIPEFCKFPQVFAACDARIHYGATWNDSLKAFYRWVAEGKDYGLERLGKTLFDPQNILRMIRDYVLFFRTDDQTQKYILRPHQMRATERIVQRVATGEAKTGLIWHTQGSGKSLTMIVAAHRLRRLPKLENPTILIVVDRRELEAQMVQNLEAFGFPAVVRAESKSHLRRLLRSDYRGLIVTLIHKFDRIPGDVNRRRNVVVLIDEAHRSQESDLGVYMRAALPNAVYFGFTGTPVDRGKVGRGTFATFGGPDPGGYLDKYGIDESIEDKATVRLYYTLAPSELHIDRETLEEEFFRAVEEAGIASIEQLNQLLQKAEKLKAVLKAPKRVEAIAQHVAEHYRTNVEPRGFKAFLVTIDREACALYKEALDRYLPEAYSQPVYTPNHKDPELLRRYHLSDDEEKQARKAFRDADKEPKILIVTEKLLTGYDAPVLYAMYLDKPLKDHTLLQAIARVNRPYPGKESGLIVDYVGILENLQRALAFDADAVGRALIDLQALREQFAVLIAEIERALAPLRLDVERGRVERIIEHFFEPAPREAFMEQCKTLQTAYEILAPDPFLRDYLDRYALIAQVYQVLYEYFDPEAQKRRIQYDLLEKTDSLIRERVEVVYLASPLPEYPITRDIARTVASDEVSDQVKVVNLYRTLLAHIEQHGRGRPYLVSIGEEVEAILTRLRERQISAQMALEQMQAKAEEIARAQDEQEQSDLSGTAFALFWVLQAQGLPDAEAKAREVEEILEDHPYWPYNKKVERQARVALYKALRGSLGNDAARLRETVDHLMTMHRTVLR